MGGCPASGDTANGSVSPSLLPGDYGQNTCAGARVCTHREKGSVATVATGKEEEFALSLETMLTSRLKGIFHRVSIEDHFKTPSTIFIWARVCISLAL